MNSLRLILLSLLVVTLGVDVAVTLKVVTMVLLMAVYAGAKCYHTSNQRKKLLKMASMVSTVAEKARKRGGQRRDPPTDTQLSGIRTIVTQFVKMLSSMTVKKPHLTAEKLLQNLELELLNRTKNQGKYFDLYGVSATIEPMVCEACPEYAEIIRDDCTISEVLMDPDRSMSQEWWNRRIAILLDPELLKRTILYWNETKDGVYVRPPWFRVYHDTNHSLLECDDEVCALLYALIEYLGRELAVEHSDVALMRPLIQAVEVSYVITDDEKSGDNCKNAKDRINYVQKFIGDEYTAHITEDEAENLDDGITTILLCAPVDADHLRRMVSLGRCAKVYCVGPDDSQNRWRGASGHLKASLDTFVKDFGDWKTYHTRRMPVVSLDVVFQNQEHHKDLKEIAGVWTRQQLMPHLGMFLGTHPLSNLCEPFDAAFQVRYVNNLQQVIYVLESSMGIDLERDLTSDEIILLEKWIEAIVEVLRNRP